MERPVLVFFGGGGSHGGEGESLAHAFYPRTRGTNNRASASPRWTGINAFSEYR